VSSLSRSRRVCAALFAVACAAAFAVQSWSERGPAGMAWIPGGEFAMGSEHPLAQWNERPVHRVQVTASGWTAIP
jgi:formylglycine-generating enzyme required for sulfatase activity